MTAVLVAGAVAGLGVLVLVMVLAPPRVQAGSALARHTAYSVILPVTGDGPFPVLLQLHGYSDDHTSWLYSSNLVRHAASERRQGNRRGP